MQIDPNWWERLEEAIKLDGRAKSAISREMGRGNSYIQQLITERKCPSVENLMKICDTINADFIYIVTGHKLDADFIEYCFRFEDLSKKDKETVRQFLGHVFHD